MSKNKIGLYWFTNDLRVQDNPLLLKASREVDALICIYVMPAFTRYLQHYSQETQFGPVKAHFIKECLIDLNHSLSNFGQCLLIVDAEPMKVLEEQITHHQVTHLYCDTFAGTEEQSVLEHLTSRHSDLQVTQLNTRMLFNAEQLPFEIQELPVTFTQFRKKVENIDIRFLEQSLTQLPPPVSLSHVHRPLHLSSPHKDRLFKGGESAGHLHCEDYFSNHFASQYKATRNALDEPNASTRFSPWLALGCISPHRVLTMLQSYESRMGANDSTYWIFFELLWREYFYWNARKIGRRLFHCCGESKTPPLTRFCSQRFKQWKQGTTPFAIVNACMNQLKQTGYISNRGRQLVASCLIHELSIDWRYGAAYFESQLIDYDTASNWGNWQYIAGVGCDPRGGRKFDLIKQTQIYDPESTFITKWQGRVPPPYRATNELALPVSLINDIQGGR